MYILSSKHISVDKYFAIIWQLLQVYITVYLWLQSVVKLHLEDHMKMWEPFIDLPCDNVNKREININEQ